MLKNIIKEKLEKFESANCWRVEIFFFVIFFLNEYIKNCIFALYSVHSELTKTVSQNYEKSKLYTVGKAN